MREPYPVARDARVCSDETHAPRALRRMHRCASLRGYGLFSTDLFQGRRTAFL